MMFWAPLSTRLKRADRRRALYRSDPIWRLTKLKANREYRMRRAREQSA